MKKFAFLFSSLLVVGACSNTAKEQSKTATNYSETVIETVGENKGMSESTIEIKGMSCAIMCGSAIKDGVSALAGVTIVDIDFDMERETNFCTVKFNQSDVNATAIVAKIESLKKGSYEVLDVKTSKWIEKINTDAAEQDGKTAYINLVDLIPSVFNVVTRVLK